MEITKIEFVLLVAVASVILMSEVKKDIYNHVFLLSAVLLCLRSEWGSYHNIWWNDAGSALFLAFLAFGGQVVDSCASFLKHRDHLSHFSHLKVPEDADLGRHVKHADHLRDADLDRHYSYLEHPEDGDLGRYRNADPERHCSFLKHPEDADLDRHYSYPKHPYHFRDSDLQRHRDHCREHSRDADHLRGQAYGTQGGLAGCQHSIIPIPGAAAALGAVGGALVAPLAWQF